jgi:hypothetical protein
MLRPYGYNTGGNSSECSKLIELLDSAGMSSGIEEKDLADRFSVYLPGCFLVQPVPVSNLSPAGEPAWQDEQRLVLLVTSDQILRQEQGCT